MKRPIISVFAILALIVTGSTQAETLRLLTWSGYAPDEVVRLFEEKTGIQVKVTRTNNEDMISKLRATGGSGFDLAQPSQDRITGAQSNYNIYKPIDLSKIKQDRVIESLWQTTVDNTSLDGEVYGVPHVWGTSGLVINQAKTKAVKDYTDLCKPGLTGRVSYRLKRPTLIAFAYALGLDPFAAYNDPAKYQEILNQVEEELIHCKPVVKTYWTGGDALLNLMRSGEVIAAMAWDTGGWKLNKDNPDIVFVAPRSGALGWIDTFALPRKSKNEAAAYQWINFVMQPEIAAMITAESGQFTAAKGADAHVDSKLKQQFQASFPQAAIDNIKWYPQVPAGLEEMEGKVLDRVKAARSH